MDGRLRCFKRTLKAVLWYKKYGKHLPGTTRAERRVVKYKAKIYQVNSESISFQNELLVPLFRNFLIGLKDAYGILLGS